MIVNEYGQITVSESEAFDALYSGVISKLDNLFFDNREVVDLFNYSVNQNADNLAPIKTLETPNTNLQDFDLQNQKHWFMPENYCPNLVQNLYDLCDTEEKRYRVDEELKLFRKYNMIDLLHYLKYLVDTMRSNGIVWGVGRGSSVSSYVLFLIGVHMVDSVKYNLDIREFLK